MKSIQTAALVLWMIIFVFIAFVVGQFLASENIIDITTIIKGQSNDDESTNVQTGDGLANEVVINKIGKETVRVGLNVVKDYFEDYYKSYINYIIANIDQYNADEKITIDNVLASDYVFYAVSNNVDSGKYIVANQENSINITEAEINGFVDRMFNKEIDDEYKKQGKYGYDKINKKYTIEKVNTYKEYAQELKKIENITSNKIILTYECKKENVDKTKNNQNIIKLTIDYTGGRYCITEVLREK